MFMNRMTWIVFLAHYLVLPVFAYSTTINIPADLPTIQQGIDAAVNGDTVLVAPGTYMENIDFKGKAIIVKGAKGAGATAINGRNPLNPDFGSVVTFKNGESSDSVLEGFTLTNGKGTKFKYYPGGGWFHGGGGVFCKDSSPIIRYNTISDNSVNNINSTGCGILCFHNASPQIISNTITCNMASGGGGIHCGLNSSPVIANNTIFSNYGIYGGGISCNRSSPTIINNNISNNSAQSCGGIYCIFGSFPIIDNNIISFNTSTSGSGGGIYCWNDSSCLISNNSIFNNTTKYNGGAIFISESAPVIKSNTIFNNVANTGGGGICLYTCSATVVNNIIYDNKALNFGGGVYCRLFSKVVITNNTILGNEAKHGGGIGLDYSKSDLIVINTILWNNVANKWPNIYSDSPSTLSISYSNIENGKSSIFVGPRGTLNWGPGMIDANPLFADESLHITFHSPCKDTGDNLAITELFDMEGDPRITYSAVDMGADEFHTRLYYTGKATPGNNINLVFIDTPNTAPVILWLGSGVLKSPMNISPYGYWYLQFPILLQAQFGSIPGPDGVLSSPFTIPANFPPMNSPLQAAIGMKLTNLLCIQFY